MEIGKRSVSFEIVDNVNHTVSLLNILADGDIDTYVGKVIGDIKSEKEKSIFKAS